MILSFLAPSTTYPVGGNTIIYEFATVMAERGHEVHIYHHDVWGDDALTSVDQIRWYRFRAELVHHFGAGEGNVGDGDVFFGWSPAVDENPRWGLPVCWVQGYGWYSEDDELATLRAPCPKICIAGWLVGVAEAKGVPSAELVHIPNALDHDHYRLLTPIEDRPPRLLWCYHPHPTKGADLAFEVLADVQRLRPDVEIVAFGAWPMPDPLPFPFEMTYHHDPDQAFLVDELYNSSRIFLSTSEIEGFGLPALEAMACGAALITSDNGGARDYAFDHTTALVSAYNADALTANVLTLLDDDSERMRLARAGRELAATFTWARSGELLEAFLERYLADPVGHGRPG